MFSPPGRRHTWLPLITRTGSKRATSTLRQREPTRTQRQGGSMGTHHTPVNGLASAGTSVMRCGLATTLLWIGALKFKDYEVENAEVLVTASPLTSWFRDKLGARKLGRVIGVAQMTWLLDRGEAGRPPGLGSWQLRGRGVLPRYA